MAGEGGSWLAGSGAASGNINAYTNANALRDICGKREICDLK